MFLVFYIEKSYNYGAHTIRYDLDGSHYYLCVEGNKVFLRVSFISCGYEIITFQLQLPIYKLLT